MIAFTVVNAWSCSLDHVNSFFVLSSGRSGASSPATDAVLAESWLTRPKKERRSVRLVGVGKLDIASGVSRICSRGVLNVILDVRAK